MLSGGGLCFVAGKGSARRSLAIQVARFNSPPPTSLSLGTVAFGPPWLLAVTFSYGTEDIFCDLSVT